MNGTVSLRMGGEHLQWSLESSGGYNYMWANE